MAPRYDELAVTALHLDPAAPMLRDYYLLRFPGKWKEPLRRLAQARRKGAVASIPIDSLNQAVAALIPDSVVTMAYASQGNDDQDWLLAYRNIDPRAVFTLVAAWVRAQSGSPEQVAAALAQLSSADLRWSKLSVDLVSPTDRDTAFRLLPMEVAAILSQPEAVCPHGDLTFRRCTSDSGAELISWPPMGIEEQTPYSVKIGITAQTLPTSAELLVYLTFGVRRWMPKRGILAFDHGHNVYLAPTVPYLAGLNNSRHFGRARIKRTRITDPEGKTIYEPQWDDALARVLHEAGCLARLPNPQQLTDKPLDYVQREGDAAALVYSTGMLSREKVSAGLSPGDRGPLMAWVTQTLHPHLRPVEHLPRVGVSIYPQLRRANDVAQQAESFPHQIYDVVGPRLDIELFTDTTQATSYAINALTARLGVRLPPAEQIKDDVTLIESGELTIGLRRPAVTASITADLDRDPKGAGKQLQGAVEARINHIETILRSATVPTVALVEIGGPDVYSGPRRSHDPIFAIRHGLLRTGRLSQFITPVVEPKRPARVREGREPSDANRERFTSSVDELFRQLGVRPEPLPQPPATTSLDRQPALLALWLIRQNKGRIWGLGRQVPIALLIDPTGQHIQISAPQIDWQPLHTGLLEIGKRYVNADLKCGPEEITRFAKETIDEVVGTYPDVLLLTHAQNLRSGWKFLTNTQVKLDTLGFGGEEPQPIAKYPGVRHVRVRTAAGNETPECFGYSLVEPGQPLGLWRFIASRVFGSTGSKPISASNAIKTVSKVAPYEYKDEMRAPKANAHVWNQQFIEVFVAAIQPDDVPEHWAALTHDLRWAAPYVDVTTTLPWPLHLAQSVEEYLLPTKIGNIPTGELDEELPS
jgi:hypothetical protein